jgi:hypothetical protein
MTKPGSRRKFIGSMSKASAIIGISSPTLAASHQRVERKNVFIHHVYFWLTNPGNKDDRAKLIQGLKKLSKVKTIQEFSIGVPADTRRDVIDSSYDISWLLIFKNGKDQASYQTDPIHLRFVEECSDLWQRVVVYDTVNA